MKAGDKVRADSMRALMLVLPYNTDNNTEENLQVILVFINVCIPLKKKKKLPIITKYFRSFLPVLQLPR